METEQHLGYTNYAWDIADALKDYYEAQMPEDAVEGMWGTFMRIGFGEVDWLDLARAWLKDARELVSQGDDLR